MSNVGRNCQTTDAQPSVTDGDECPAGVSRLGGESGENIHSHFCKAIIKLSHCPHGRLLF